MSDEKIAYWYKRNKEEVNQFYYILIGWLGSWTFLRTPLVENMEQLVNEYTSPLLLISLVPLIIIAFAQITTNKKETEK